jgi:hypothetical protein
LFSAGIATSFDYKIRGSDMCSETSEKTTNGEKCPTNILADLGIEPLNEGTGIEVTVENLTMLLLQSAENKGNYEPTCEKGSEKD